MALSNLTSSLGQMLNVLKVNLSPREIEICGLVKNGMLLPNWPQSFPGSSGEVLSIAAADLGNDGTVDTPGGYFIGATGAVIGDLNYDGVVEIIFCTYSISQNVSHLIILDTAGKELHKNSLSKRGTMGPPTLADVAQDGDLEIVISLKDTTGDGTGGVQIWDVTTAKTGKLPWPTGRGDLLRSGVLS